MRRLLALALLALLVTACFGQSACPRGHVRLTYDDGPHPAHTPTILDALKERNATATFFVLGENVADNRALLQRIADEGHAIGNHTWDHPHLTSLSLEEIYEQLERTSKIIEEVTGHAPEIWRPPFEDFDASVIEIATDLGMEMVLWDYESDTNDWQGRSPEEIRSTVLDTASDGTIVLMHDRVANTALATPGIVDGLHGRGFCTR